MTVAQLIEELKKQPQDLPVATMGDISPDTAKGKDWIKVERRIWEHTNHPYNKPDFDYVNLE